LKWLPDAYSAIGEEKFAFNDIPATPGFRGRMAELHGLAELFSIHKVIGVTGALGVGKSWLLSKFVKGFDTSNRITIWQTLHEDRYDLWRFAWKIALRGEKQQESLQLRELLRDQFLTGKVQTRDVVSVLSRCLLARDDLLLIIDNYAPGSSNQLIQFIEKETLQIGAESRVVLIGRENRFLVKDVRHFTLRGLCPDDLHEFVEHFPDRSVNAQEEALLYEITEGNPLIVKLIMCSAQATYMKEPFAELLRSAHRLPEIEDLYFGILGQLTTAERITLLKLLIEPQGLGGSFQIVADRITNRRETLGNLVRKGMIEDADEAFAFSRIARDCFAMLVA